MDLLELRHTLHLNAELSGLEKKTSEIILNELRKLNPDKLITNVGGFGILAIFDSRRKGDTVLFRADIDALPVHEENDLSYKSKNKGVSHKCGHDGHTAIMLGVAAYVNENRPAEGKLALLFQPSEEIGSGAVEVINDIRFKEVNPDYVFAMHNLPGYPVGSVIVKKNTFAAASKGIRIKLSGLASHASEPEKGTSPVAALTDLIQEIPLLANENVESQDYALITIVHINAGEPAFGSTPGDGLLMLTLRAWTDYLIEKVTNQIIERVKSISALHRLYYEVSYHDIFPAVVNEETSVNIIEKAALNLSLKVINPSVPFRWSEDFAHFTQETKGALFGIGSGVEHPPLHNPDYDFPDEILETTVNVWKEIYKNISFQD